MLGAGYEPCGRYQVKSAGRYRATGLGVCGNQFARQRSRCRKQITGRIEVGSLVERRALYLKDHRRSWHVHISREVHGASLFCLIQLARRNGQRGELLTVTEGLMSAL
jgi:hypothetical protein